MDQVVLGLGTNLGNRQENLDRALTALDKLPKTRVLQVSSIYETKPFDVISEQPDYLNCCALVETGLSPHALLGACLGIEAGMGRQRLEYHGSRIIDIDMLFIQGYQSNEDELKLPHPEIRKRAFVLAPLCDLFPDQNVWGFDVSEAFSKINWEEIKKS